MENNTTFETGATSAAVNELILYTDNTRELAELRDEYFEDWKENGSFGTAPHYKRFIILCHISISRYKNEMGHVNSLHITTMGVDQIKEYCQIYANRFPEWKRERERVKQFNQFHHAAKHSEYNDSWDLFRCGTRIGVISDDGKMLHLSTIAANIPFTNTDLEEISTLMKNIQDAAPKKERQQSK